MNVLTDRRNSRSKALGTGRRHRCRLFDRDSYLAELRLLFADEWRHPVGPIVIESRVGLGKTALIGAASQMAAEAGWAVLRARGDPLKEHAPLSLLRRLIDFHTAGEDESPVHDGEAAAIVTKLDKLVRKLSVDQGVLICVDDAQWCDEESIERLYGLGHWPLKQRCRLIVGMAARSPGLQLRTVERITSEPSTRVMSLGSLSQEGVSSFAAAYFGLPPDEGFVECCQEEVGGNPSLLLALFRELHLKGIGPSADAIEEIRALSSPAVARSVLSRLALLAPEAARVLEAVSVANGGVSVDVVAEMTDIDAVEIGSVADALAAADLLKRERPLRFLHPLVRRTVYAEISSTRAAQLHLRLAHSLKLRQAGVELFAEHLAASEPAGNEWVASSLEEAGRLALSSGASAKAIKYLRRALADHTTAGRRSDILVTLAQAEVETDVVSAIEHLRRALEEGVDPKTAAHTATQLARSVRDIEIRTELGPILDQVSGLLAHEALADKINIAVAVALVGSSPLSPIIAADSIKAVLETGLHPDTRAGREALALVAVVSDGSPKRASAAEVGTLIRRAMLGAQFVSDDPLSCELWARALLSLARSGSFEEVDRHLRGIRTIGRSQNLDLADAELSLTLAMSLRLQGSLVDAEDEANWALSVAEGLPWARRREAVASLVGILLDQGRSENVPALLSQFGDSVEKTSPLAGPVLLEQRGRLRLLQGRRSEALADLFAAGSRAEECEVDNPAVTSWRSEVAHILSEDGRDEDAFRIAEENLELARAYGAEWVVGSALHLLACVGEADERLDRLEEAVQLLDALPARLRLAEAMIDLGRALREIDPSSPRVRELLRGAADLAFRGRATPLVSSATTELRLSGARPRRLALSGADALTSSERRVIARAADGMSNAEIASELFLAEKTVEGHLGRSFRKLGIRSRRELEAMRDLRGSEPNAVG